MPGAGPLVKMLTPEPSSSVRIETGVRPGDEVSVHYDPMIAKLVVWDKDRNSALRKLRHSLGNFNVLGLKTNIDFLSKLSSHPKFEEGLVYTNFIADHFQDLFPGKEASRPSNQVLSAAAMGWVLTEKLSETKRAGPSSSPFSASDDFRLHGTSQPTRKVTLALGDQKYTIQVTNSSGGFEVKVDGKEVGSSVRGSVDEATNELSVEVNGGQQKYKLLRNGQDMSLFTPDMGSFPFQVVIPSYLESGSSSELGSSSGVVAPMPGVIEKVMVTEGQVVKPGDSLVVMIAMKMEYVIKANQEAKIKQISYKVGDNVAKGAPLVVFEETS
jgi:3-methylcrotonyl-CoA carboxylase alpha subunit